MKSAQLTHPKITLPKRAQDPFNPHPVFPLWSPWDVYPYPYYGSVRKYETRETYYMPTLENDFLRVTIAPDVGGRIWDVYDKVGARHVVNFTNQVDSYNAGFGLNYTTGGIECNYPLAHACTTNRKREVSSRVNPDGSASIVCSEYERIWRTRWSVTYTLYPDRSYLELRVRIYNRTPFDSRYMYWNNCGFYLTPNTQYIFPEDEGSMHGQELTTFSWPLWRHRDLSMWGQVPPEMLGLYMLNAAEPFFGYYDHDAQYGLVHYGDLADVPGKKTWTWGTDPAYCDMLRKTHHGLDKVYGEIQSGRIVIQEHLDRVPPETEMEWTEIWYPVRGTGAFNGAGPGAALRAELVESAAEHSVLNVAAMGNGRFPKARLIVVSDGMAPVERPFALDPVNAAEATITLKGQAGPAQHTQVFLKDADGCILARARLRAPNRRDSWKEPVDFARPVKPVGTEELFFEAEKTARDWGNHDLRPVYEKVLAVDSGFSPALRELGKIALRRGEYDQAVAHFAKARQRDPDSMELRYFQGLALVLAGQVEAGRRLLELASRYHWEAAALTRLAELAMREQDWHQALKHLDRLAGAFPRLTRPRGLRTACLRKLGRTREAAAEITAVRAVDAQDPFLQFEALLATPGDAGPRRPARTKLLMDAFTQVWLEEPAPLEAAFDYLSAGLFDESVRITQMMDPEPGPLPLFVRAFALSKLGREKEAARALQDACAADVTYQHPWQLEFIPILEWARATLPKQPRPVFLLGNLLMARRRTEEGRQLWETAARQGEKHWLLFANLGYYANRVGKDAKTALTWFRKAEKANPEDLYVIVEIAGLLNSTGSARDVVRYLEARKSAVMSSPRVAYALLGAYLKLNQYGKFDALCAEVDFRHNWQIAGPHSLWMPRHYQEAAQLIEAGKPDAALAILEGLTGTPAHLGVQGASDAVEDRRLYHMGRCHEKLGRPDAARECWEKALDVPHFTGYEHAYWYREWSRRYFQALCLQKLGRESEANTFLDSMELLAHTHDLPVSAKKSILDMVERGRFASEHLKDPLVAEQLKVQTRAEE
ncbi:MAG: hypothetical protein A3K19_15405 [Lentisphaerae bacterium RIFOXYB12_FULL_65_16]|nr:MAG: hypothetical protein A3K18_26540 [Lentisphaerae bacterium RIFOXYA12_64_32]OGV88486.1 MAG: hypothetical protein A3K19_15405 [Lentisphaerae bacterium RIFOXYB12_FULL_65_16]